MSTIRFRRLIIAGLLLFTQPTYAAEPKEFNHSFSFGDYSGKENQGIEILNYRYGNSKVLPTSPADWQLSSDHVKQRIDVSGLMPVGDSLYVKWRVKSTGTIYEDTVDLKRRLPSAMTDKRIHFLIKGPRLYVYLISDKKGHASGGPDCPARVYRDHECTELYPDHWKNF